MRTPLRRSIAKVLKIARAGGRSLRQRIWSDAYHFPRGSAQDPGPITATLIRARAQMALAPSGAFIAFQRKRLVRDFTSRLRGNVRQSVAGTDWRPGRVCFLTLVEPSRGQPGSGPYRQVGQSLRPQAS